MPEIAVTASAWPSTLMTSPAIETAIRCLVEFLERGEHVNSSLQTSKDAQQKDIDVA
jgi:hypothetical protein